MRYNLTVKRKNWEEIPSRRRKAVSSPRVKVTDLIGWVKNMPITTISVKSLKIAKTEEKGANEFRPHPERLQDPGSNFRVEVVPPM